MHNSTFANVPFPMTFIFLYCFEKYVITHLGRNDSSHSLNSFCVSATRT